MGDVIYKEESFKIIGAAFHVHQILGAGFSEEVYQEALEIEFDRRGIPYKRKVRLNIDYDGVRLLKYYEADLVCYDKIIVELKALSALDGDHRAQTINYLKATGLRLGLLINFGESSLKYERLFKPYDRSNELESTN